MFFEINGKVYNDATTSDPWLRQKKLYFSVHYHAMHDEIKILNPVVHTNSKRITQPPIKQQVLQPGFNVAELK